jgi:hypothetical protein
MSEMHERIYHGFGIAVELVLDAEGTTSGRRELAMPCDEWSRILGPHTLPAGTIALLEIYGRRRCDR